MTGGAFFDDAGGATQATGLVRVEVAVWSAEEDPAGAAVVDVTRGDAVLGLPLAAEAATVVEVRMVDATGNTHAVDEEGQVSIKVYRRGLEDDTCAGLEDDVLNPAASATLRVSNDAGRAARKDEEERMGREAAEQRKEYRRLKAAIKDKDAEVKALKAEQKTRRKAKQRRDRDAAARDDRARELAAAAEARVSLEAELASLGDEDADAAPRRAMTLARDTQMTKTLERFRAELVREFAKEGLPESDLRGFASELATVERDSDNACLAYLIGRNRLYVASARAERVAHRVGKDQGIVKLGVTNLSLLKAGPGWTEAYERRLAEKTHEADRAAGAVYAASLLEDCDAVDRSTVFWQALSHHRALIFRDDASLEAADAARGSAAFPRVARDCPGRVHKADGMSDIGTYADKPPPFSFASPAPRDGRRADLDARLRDARDDEDRLRALVEDHDDDAGNDGAAADPSTLDADVAAAEADAERMKAELKEIAAVMGGAPATQPPAAPKRGIAALAAAKQPKRPRTAAAAPGKEKRKRGRDSAGTKDTGVSNGPPTAGGADSDDSDAENRLDCQPAAKRPAASEDWFENEENE